MRLHDYLLMLICAGTWARKPTSGWHDITLRAQWRGSTGLCMKKFWAESRLLPLLRCRLLMIPAPARGAHERCRTNFADCERQATACGNCRGRLGYYSRIE